MAYRYSTAGSMETSASAMARGEKRANRRRENAIPSGTMMVDEYDRAERFTRINIDDVDQRRALEQKEDIRQKEERELQDQQRLERRKRRFQNEAAESERVLRKIEDDKKSSTRLKVREITVVSDSPEPKRTRSPESVVDVEEEVEKKKSLAKERMKEKMGRGKYFDKLKAKLTDERNKIRNSANADAPQSAMTKALPRAERDEPPSPVAVILPSSHISEKKAPAAPDALKTDAREAVKSGKLTDKLTKSNACAPTAGQGSRRVDSDFRKNRAARRATKPIPDAKMIEPKSAPTPSDASNREHSDEKAADAKNITLHAVPMCAASTNKADRPKRDAKTVIPNGGVPPPNGKIPPTKADATNPGDSDHKDVNVEAKPLRSKRSSPDKPVPASTAVTGTEKPSPDASNSERSVEKAADAKNITLPASPMCAASKDKASLPKHDDKTVISNEGSPSPNAKISPTKADATNHDDSDHKDVNVEAKPHKNRRSSPDEPGPASTAVTGTEKPSPDLKASPRVAKPSQVPRQASRSIVVPPTQAAAAAGQTASAEQPKFQFTPIVFNQKTSQPSSRLAPTGKPVAAKPPAARRVPSEPATKHPPKCSSEDATKASKPVPSEEKLSASPTVAAVSTESDEKAAESSEKTASVPTCARSSSEKPAVAKGAIPIGPPHGVESTTTERSTAQTTKMPQKTTAPPAKAGSASTASVIKSLGKPTPRSSKTPSKVVTNADAAESPEVSSGLKRKERPSEEEESARKRRETESLWAEYGAELTELEETLLEMRPDLISTLDDELRTISRDFADPAAFDRELHRLESLL